MVFSFQWALTHRSIPRILPDSSYFPKISSNFLSKFDLRMNYHQSNVLLQDLSNSFHRWLNLFVLILPECLNNSWWCFSSSFSTFEVRRRVFLHILSVLSETRGSSLMPSSHDCFDRENSFHPSGAIQDSFQFVSPEPIISEFIHSQLSAMVLQILPVLRSSDL